MAKPELGAKRQCQHCGAKFFDLNKDPIVCPKCGTVFQGAARTRVPVKEDEEETELAAPPGVDVVSLDEVEAGEEKVAETAVDDIDVEDESPEFGGGCLPPGGGGGRRRRHEPDRRRHCAGRGALTPGSARSPALFFAAALVAGEGLRLYRRPRGFGASPQTKTLAQLSENGAIAQLGERFNGIEEVVGSIPSGSTNNNNYLEEN